MSDRDLGSSWIKDHINTAHESIEKPVVLEEFGILDIATRDEIYDQWLNDFVQ